MKDLQLPLKKYWFEMTKLGIKTEDYREVNDYWCARLLEWNGTKVKRWNWFNRLHDNVDNSNEENILNYIKKGYATFINFENNIITLGYPKSGDKKRIIRYKHEGIEIRKGNSDWGAKPDKYYFVIKHGKIIND